MTGALVRAAAVWCLGALVCALGSTLGSAAAAPMTGGIAAVVNDEAVSVRDLENRIDLFLLTANLDNAPAVRERVAPQILETLIDETLKKQEARRLNITVSGEDVDQAMSDVGRQLGISAEGLADYLRRRGVPVATMIEQIQTEIGWIKTVNRLARNLVSVTDEDVEIELQRRREASGELEYRVTEIFLPVDDPAQEDRIRALADELLSQLRRGASFPALARIFSQGAAASMGGDLGWVRPGQLDPAIDGVLRNVSPGQVAGPIRSRSGYHLIALIGQRASLPSPEGRIQLSLRQLFAALPANSSVTAVNAAVQRLAALSQNVGSCDEFIGRAGDGVIADSMDGVDLRRLPPPLQQILAPMAPGDVTRPLPTGDGVVVLMVCDRVEQTGDAEVRDVIYRFLREQRLAAASRRFLRDLRRDALIDVRL